MNQKKINKAVNRVVKTILNAGELLNEEKTHVIDLEDRFCFWNPNTKQLYTGKSILHKYNSLSNETLRSSQVFNYTIGAKIEGKEVNYLLHKDRSIKDLNNLYNEIITKY